MPSEALSHHLAADVNAVRLVFGRKSELHSAVGSSDRRRWQLAKKVHSPPLSRRSLSAPLRLLAPERFISLRVFWSLGPPRDSLQSEAMFCDFWASSWTPIATSDIHLVDLIFGGRELAFKKLPTYKSRAITCRRYPATYAAPRKSAPQSLDSSQPLKLVKGKASSKDSSIFLLPDSQSAKAKKIKAVQRAKEGYKFACLPCKKYYNRRQDLKKHYTLMHDGASPPSFEMVLDPTDIQQIVASHAYALSPAGKPDIHHDDIPSSPPSFTYSESDEEVDLSSLIRTPAKPRTKIESCFKANDASIDISHEAYNAIHDEPRVTFEQEEAENIHLLFQLVDLSKSTTIQDELDFINFVSPKKATTPAPVNENENKTIPPATARDALCMPDCIIGQVHNSIHSTAAGEGTAAIDVLSAILPSPPSNLLPLTSTQIPRIDQERGCFPTHDKAATRYNTADTALPQIAISRSDAMASGAKPGAAKRCTASKLVGLDVSTGPSVCSLAKPKSHRSRHFAKHAGSQQHSLVGRFVPTRLSTALLPFLRPS